MPANLLHEQKGGARSGQKAPDRTLRVFNLTESFAADSLQIQQFGRVDTM